MERRVAFLRAINVGGTGTLRMARLLDLVEGLGWKEASTFGASGNVLYTAGRRSAAGDAAQLAQALAEVLGRPPTVIVRSRGDLEALLAAKPFARTAAAIPPKWWFVGFLAAGSKAALPPIPEGSPLAYARRFPREVCWTMASPHLRAIDHPKRIERALDTPMTVRNWNVVGQVAQRLAA